MRFLKIVIKSEVIAGSQLGLLLGMFVYHISGKSLCIFHVNFWSNFGWQLKISQISDSSAYIYAALAIFYYLFPIIMELNILRTRCN